MVFRSIHISVLNICKIPCIDFLFLFLFFLHSGNVIPFILYFVWATNCHLKKLLLWGFCSTAIFSKLQHLILFREVGSGVIKIDTCVSVVMPRAA